MKTVMEAVGLIFVMVLVVWIFQIASAPIQEKPIAACKPVALAASVSSSAIKAFAPNGGVSNYASSGEMAVDRACLTYAANWFQVTSNK